jgi:mannan endo-1,4-beta-mannosidase
MNYNPLYGWDDGTTERIIEWGTERNGIPTVCWHINVPKDFSSYEIGDAVDWSKCTYKPDETDFDTANAVIEGTKEYEYVMLTIEKLAEQLQKVQDAGVPIIFRPYHEAEGNGGEEGSWFWWGKAGSETYKALWKQLYTTLTEEYGIHNLIWEFNSYDYTTSINWYPGDEWVDIVGYDKYNTVYNRHDGKTSGPNEDAISGTFYDLVDITNNTKMVSMPENSTVPSLSNILTEKAYWLYFCIWYDNGSDNFLTGSDYNDYDTLKEMYQSDYCITLSELPDWKNYTSQSAPEFTPGDVNDDGVVNVFDSILLKKYLLDDGDVPAVLAASPYDTDGNGIINSADLVLLNEFLTGKNVKLTYYKEQDD